MSHEGQRRPRAARGGGVGPELANGIGPKGQVKGQVSITGTSGGACKGNRDFVWGSKRAGEGQAKGR